jgi:hypothetical protein
MARASVDEKSEKAIGLVKMLLGGIGDSYVSMNVFTSSNGIRNGTLVTTYKDGKVECIVDNFDHSRKPDFDFSYHEVPRGKFVELLDVYLPHILREGKKISSITLNAEEDVRYDRSRDGASVSTKDGKFGENVREYCKANDIKIIATRV